MSISTITRNGNDYGVYATVVEADMYLEPDPELGNAWEELTDSDKEKRLIGATRRLDRFVWQGEPSGGRTQVLAWPRRGLQYADGTAVGISELPFEVELATILLAGDLDFDLAATAGGTGEVSQSQTIGRKSETFYRQQISSLEDLLPLAVYTQIGQWLGRRRKLIGPTVTGRTTKVPSEFDERYERRAWNSVG